MIQLIAIKGNKQGLRLQLDESAAWESVLTALRQQLDGGASFFQGAQVMVDIGERAIEHSQLATLLELMALHGLRPEALATSAHASREAARAAGVTARPLNRAAAEAEARGEALFVQRTLRSGQLIRHHGHVTVLGDVNAGAEIIAAGNVLVWGRLRGIVHAGALGERSAVIAALELAPTQLRIADLIARTPDGGSDGLAEVARIDDDRIIVEVWQAYRNKV